MRRALHRRLESFPPLLAALHLGECIDEGRHPTLRPEMLIVYQRTAAWRLYRQRATSHKSTPPKPARSRQYQSRIYLPGEAPVEPTWLQELWLLWQKAVPSRQCPPIPSSYVALPEKRRHLVAWLIAKVHEALTRPTALSGAADDATVWPPNMGWCFRDGEFVFRGNRYKLSGIPLKLLRTVQASRFPIRSLDLRSAIWPDPPDAEQDQWQRLRAVISELNKTLRDLFAGEDSIPQVKAVDPTTRGQDRKWHLVMVPPTAKST